MPLPSLTKKYYHAPYPAIDPSNPALSASGKVIVITGGGSGVGRATALAFAKAGAKVVAVLGRREGPLNETRAQIERLGTATTAAIYPVDISDEDSVAKCFGDIETKYGPIDVCSNAAAYLSNKGTVRDSKVSDFWASFEVGVKGSFIVAQQFLRHCSDQDPVLIGVNSFIAHLAAVHLETAPASYASSKISVAKLIEYVAKEEPGVRAYSLQPGVIETEMSKKSVAMLPEEKQEAHPFLPWDDASLPGCFSVWLASPEGRCIPSGRYLWSNWDVEELKARAKEFQDDPFALVLTLPRWPFPMPEEDVQPDYEAAARMARLS